MQRKLLHHKHHVYYSTVYTACQSQNNILILIQTKFVNICQRNIAFSVSFIFIIVNSKIRPVGEMAYKHVGKATFLFFLFSGIWYSSIYNKRSDAVPFWG